MQQLLIKVQQVLSSNILGHLFRNHSTGGIELALSAQYSLAQILENSGGNRNLLKVSYYSASCCVTQLVL
jgi:hypothetical protein